MGKCFDEATCSQIIGEAIQRASSVCGTYVPTKVIEEAVHADAQGKAFAETAARKCQGEDAHAHIGYMIGWFSRRYTDSENNNPSNLRGKPYYCDYRDKFERQKDATTRTWSYKKLGT
jgi:hypothetical protein